LVFAIILALAWYLRPSEDPPVPMDENAADTGMSAAQREALMRTIGYVQ